MKIDYLHIQSTYKNLDNVKVDFDEDHLMTVIVGGNGSGKSNVLEALVRIFRDLDLEEIPLFKFEIKYCLGAKKNPKWMTLYGDHKGKTLTEQYKLFSSDRRDVLGKKISVKSVTKLRTGKSEYLPQFIFAYYSGPSDRLEDCFKQHRANFYHDLLYNKVEALGDMRRFFYAKPIHSQFVLMAFFLENKNSDERQFLKEHLGIVDLDSVHFVLREPPWKQPKNRDELFWGANGVVREFLDALIPHSLAPLKVARIDQDEMSLTGKRKTKEFFHLFLKDSVALKKVAKDYGPDIFFKMLESTLLSEVLKEVLIRVKVKTSSESLSFRELSEGEQQLLTVLGLLKFTGGKDALFLLDEPDTHLNPAWTVKYLEFLRKFVPDKNTSHLLMVSHHPLAIAELKDKQIQVMKRSEEKVIAFKPSKSPQGMGINLLLRSDMFGLKTTLDNPTNRDVTRRNELASKEILSKPEEKELKILNINLEKLGFSIATDDPDYMDFLFQKYHTPENKDN